MASVSSPPCLSLEKERNARLMDSARNTLGCKNLPRGFSLGVDEYELIANSAPNLAIRPSRLQVCDLSLSFRISGPAREFFALCLDIRSRDVWHDLLGCYWAEVFARWHEVKALNHLEPKLIGKTVLFPGTLLAQNDQLYCITTKPGFIEQPKITPLEEVLNQVCVLVPK